MSTVTPATIQFDAASDGGADSDAYAIAQQIGGYTEAEIQFGLAVARAESYYGKAWRTPSKSTIELSQRFGLTGYEGVNSNNWGSVQGAGDNGSFPHVDHNAKGVPYVGQYRAYSTPVKGAAAFFRILYGGGPTRKQVGADAIRAAVNRGSLTDAVNEQHANGYFELAPSKYLSAVIRNYDALTANLGWTPLLSLDGNGITMAGATSGAGKAVGGASGAGRAVGAVLLVAAGVVSYLGYTGKLFSNKEG